MDWVGEESYLGRRVLILKRILGWVQKNVLVFGINRNYFRSFMTVFFAVSMLVINETCIPILQGQGLSISIIFSIAAALFTLYTFFVESMERVKRQDELIEVTPLDYHSHIIKNTCLDEIYIKDGYELKSYANEFYLMSQDINEMLCEEGDRIKLIKTGKFHLSNISEEVSPLAVKRAFSKKTFIFNGHLLRLVDDITKETFNGQNKLRLQSCRYFDGLCTNEMVYSHILNLSHLDGELFEGWKLVFDKFDGEKYKLKPLKKTYCANYLGGSTLGITKDNHIILTKNPLRSDINSSKYVPSGSGSTDVKDYKKGDSYAALVTKTMERELREECTIDKYVSIKTHLIGHARLLTRGGKPDFWGVSYIDCYFSDIGVSKKEMREMGKYGHHVLQFDNHSDIAHVLKKFVDNPKNEVSLQLKVMSDLLLVYEEKGIDVWGFVSPVGNLKHDMRKLKSQYTYFRN